jgi:hypothetical protein
MVGHYCRAWFGWRFVLLFASVDGFVDLQWTVFDTAPGLADGGKLVCSHVSTVKQFNVPQTVITDKYVPF